jgi:hypothetical protein
MGLKVISFLRKRVDSCLAVLGIFSLTAGTILHPMHEDPNNAGAAFKEYAADKNWHNSHLLQLLGVTLLVVLMIRLARVMKGGPAGSLAFICTLGAGAGLAIACALQAVDGIALKAMIDLWAAAPTDQQLSLFHSVLAIRQIEIGLASMFSFMLGAVLILFGIAQFIEGRFPKLLGIVLAVYGATSVVAGYIMANSGFSDLAMAINMPASVLLLLWAFATAYFCWKQIEKMP